LDQFSSFQFEYFRISVFILGGPTCQRLFLPFHCQLAPPAVGSHLSPLSLLSSPVRAVRGSPRLCRHARATVDSQALTKFCERHLPVLGDTAIALLPIRNEGNAVWSERVADIDDPELLTHHACWTLTAHYAQHVSSLLHEVTAMGAHLCLRLEDCTGQVKAKNHIIKDIQEGNRELLQKNARLEMRIRELNDELMRTYCSRDFKTDDLDDTRT
jgi:hypothetical protein